MTRPWALVGSAGVTVGALGGLLPVILLAVVVAVGNVLARSPWLLVGVVALIGGVTGTMRASTATIPDLDGLVVASEVAEGRLVGHPQIGPSGPRAVVDVDRVALSDGGWAEARGHVLVFFQDTAEHGLGRGDRVRLRWRVTPLDAQESGFRGFIRSSGASADAWSFHTTVLERGDDRLNVLVRFRDTLTGRLADGIGGDGGALLAGFVTGDDSGLSGAARDAFERTNTSHITAVSGSNVAVLVTMWLAVVRRRRFQRAVGAQLLLLSAIWAYVALVGFGPGAVRAGLFASILLPAARLGRRADPLTSLMLASAAMLLALPGFAESVGFWLSMAASAAMVTVVGHGRRAPVWLQGILALVAAQVATFPITFWAFDGWSPGSLVANLLLGPLVALVFPLAFVSAGLLWPAPWLAGVVGWVPKLGADAIIAVVESLAGEFPLLRPSVETPVSLLLLAAMCGLVIAAMSADVQRWLRRVAAVRSITPTIASAAMFGAGLGIWLVAVAMAAVG